MERAPATESLLKLRTRVERALQPYEEEVDERLAEEQAEKETQELVREAGLLLDSVLRDEYEWDSAYERWGAERELRKPLESTIRKAHRRGEVCYDTLQDFVSDWVNEKLDDENDD